MIVADRKPFDEILEMLGEARRVLVCACNTCVTVCHAGGRREAELLASQLRIHARENGREIEVREHTLERHCDAEFVADLGEHLDWSDVMLSMACGVGVNLVAETYPSKRVVPALNTTFLGATDVPGRWREMCAGCGDCVLHLTGGVCPVVRCAKSMLNGPCGGSQNGKCEVDPNVDCAWHQIIERLEEQGLAETLAAVRPLKDWSPSMHGGWRRSRIVEEVFSGEEGGQ